MRTKVIGLIAAVAVMATTNLPSASLADPWGEGLEGALGGAIFGAIVGGKDGAATGAILGGAMGVASGSAKAKEKKKQKKQRRREAERAQWERERQQLQQQTLQAQQQAQQQQAAAPQGGGSVDAVLMTETQKSLIRLGYDPGPVDGQPGDQTVDAIKGYQRDKGLLDTGQPSQELLKHMIQSGG